MVVGDEATGLLTPSVVPDEKPAKELYLQGEEPKGLVSFSAYPNSEMSPEEIEKALDKDSVFGAVRYQVQSGMRAAGRQFTSEMQMFVGRSMEEDMNEVTQIFEKAGEEVPSDVRKTVDYRRDLAQRWNATALAARRRALLFEKAEQEKAIGSEVSVKEELAMGVTSAAMSVAPYLGVAAVSGGAGAAGPVISSVGQALVFLGQTAGTFFDKFQQGEDIGKSYDENVFQAAEVAGVQGSTDLLAGRFLSRLYGTGVEKAVQKLVGRATGRVGMAKVVGRAAGQGLVVEGATEGLQTINEDIADALSGIDTDPSFGKTVRHVLVAIVAGGVTGGAVNVGGVLVQRRKIVNALMEKNQALSRKTCEQIADTLIYESLNETQKHVSERFELGSEVTQLTKKLRQTNQRMDVAAELEARLQEPKVEEVTEPGEVLKFQEVLQWAEGQVVGAKVSELEKKADNAVDEVRDAEEELAKTETALSEAQKVGNNEKVGEEEKRALKLREQFDETVRRAQNLRARSEGVKLGVIEAKGKIFVPSGLIRKNAHATLREAAKAYRLGAKLEGKALKDVQKASLSLLSQLNATHEQKGRMLRKLFSLTPKNYEEKIDGVIQTIVQLQESARVEEYRDIVRQALSKTLQSVSVPVGVQKIAAHLDQVMKGQVVSGGEKAQSSFIIEIMEENIEELKGEVSEERARQLAEVFVDFSSEQFARRLQDWGATEGARTEQAKALAESLWRSTLTREQIDKGYQDSLVKIDSEGTVKVVDNAQRASGTTIEKQRTRLIGLGLPTQIFRALNAVAEVLDRGQLSSRIREGIAVTTLDLDKVTRDWKWGVVDKKQKESEVFAEVFKGKNVHLETIFFQTLPLGAVLEQTINGQRGTKRLTRAETISLYLLGLEPKTRNELIKNNKIDETWLDKFMAEPGFSEGEKNLVRFYQQQYAEYPGRYAPVWERVTGLMAPVLENYFPRSRYRRTSGQVEQEVSATGQIFAPDGSVDINAIRELKKRSRGMEPIEIESASAVFNRYVNHMEHFIAAAEWVQNARKVMFDSRVEDAIRTRLGDEYVGIVQTAIDNVARGGALEVHESGLTLALNKMFVNLGAARLFGPEHAMRQLTSLPAFLRFMDLKDMVAGFIDLPRAITTKEIEVLYNHPEMKLRRVGMQNFTLSQLSELSDINDLLKDLQAVSSGKDTALNRAKILLRGANRAKTVRALVRGWVIFGDQASSLSGGWGVYKKYREELGEAKALEKAAQAISATQQSMSLGRRPEFYTKTGVMATLFNLFQQYDAQYMSEFLAVYGEAVATVKREGWGAATAFIPAKAGEVSRSRITYGDLASTTFVYFAAIPMMNALFVSALQGELDKTLERFKRYMIWGPFSGNAWVGEWLAAMYSALADSETGEAEEMYKRDMQNTNILQNTEKRVAKIVKAVKDKLEGEQGVNTFSEVFLPLASIAVEARTALNIEELTTRGYALGHAVLATGQSAAKAWEEFTFAVTGRKPKVE